MPRGFAGESERQEARTIGGGRATEATRAAVERGRESVQRSMDRNRERQAVAQHLGITDDNPYGKMSGLSRTLGAENVSYAGNMSLNQRRGIANLMIDRYLDPVDPATGRVRPGLGVGDPTRFGTVERDPSLRKKGLGSFFPGVGLITALFDRSDLTVPGFPSSQDATAVQEDTAQAVVPPAFTPERQANFQADVDEAIARSDLMLAENAAKRQLAAMSDDPNYFAQILPAIPEPRIRDFEIQPTGTTFNEPINPPIRTELNVTRTGAAPDMASISPLPEPSLPNLPSLDPMAEFQSDLGMEPITSADFMSRGERIDQMLDAAEAAKRGRQIREDVRTFGARSSSPVAQAPVTTTVASATPLRDFINKPRPVDLLATLGVLN
tara:strand:+ start:583 stop:1728 length:1146 start_codon:yes stop_codon:yes gene_type:complete